MINRYLHNAWWQPSGFSDNARSHPERLPSILPQVQRETKPAFAKRWLEISFPVNPHELDITIEKRKKKSIRKHRKTEEISHYNPHKNRERWNSLQAPDELRIPQNIKHLTLVLLPQKGFTWHCNAILHTYVRTKLRTALFTFEEPNNKLNLLSTIVNKPQQWTG